MLTIALYAIGLAFAVVAIIAAVAIYTRHIEDRERKRANKETQDHAIRLTNRALIVEAEHPSPRSPKPRAFAVSMCPRFSGAFAMTA